MLKNLQEDSLRLASELASILEEPLYVLDDEQVFRIGETYVRSGRVSGIHIQALVTGMVLGIPAIRSNSAIPDLRGTIVRNGMDLGTYI
ncbi:MAG: hypothetical protein KKI09_07770 [Spirochaetes bacterium]|nr:hypothetical protein [Spirochaetota bacterium]